MAKLPAELTRPEEPLARGLVAGLLDLTAARVQRLADRAVAAVNVAISDDVAVAGRGRREIGDVDRNRRRQRHRLVAAGVDAAVDLRAVPLPGRREQQCGEIADVLGADAAM